MVFTTRPTPLRSTISPLVASVFRYIPLILRQDSCSFSLYKLPIDKPDCKDCKIAAVIIMQTVVLLFLLFCRFSAFAESHTEPPFHKN